MDSRFRGNDGGRTKRLALALALLATPALADGLIDNANGYTFDGKGQLVRFNGLLIDERGKVAKLLDRNDKRPEKLDFRLDAGGRTVVPGLVDAHSHVMALGEAALSLDLSGTRSLAEMQAALRTYAAARPTPPWIRGGGWNQERWGLGRFPTAADIDAVTPGRPVVLDRVDGHALLANSAAIAAAGITAATKDPPGGRIERDARGRPTGVFVDAAQKLIMDAVPPMLPRDRDAALAKAQEILLGYGITATADMGTSDDDWQVMRRAGDAGRLRVRILSYAGGIPTLLAIAGTGPTPWLYDGRLRMIGVKLYGDGALGSRGAWLKAPYADAPGQKGLQFLDDAKLRNLMSRAAMDGFQTAVHAIGDAANAQVLDAIDELAATYKGDRRWRIEHAQIVDPADLPRFAKNGIVASMQPVHQTSDRLMAEARLGPNRLGGAYAWKAMLDNKVPLAFGSDTPVESPNPFPAMAAAVSRQDPAGQPPGGWQPQQAVSLTEAFRAFTTTAAYAGFAEDRIGSLAPGHMADFLILDRDIFTAGIADLRAARPLETWIGGKRAWTATPGSSAAASATSPKGSSN
ncbi:MULTISPECIES: amidohydrolase [unclassified Sphingomonas]|uniref:amidohydrolase n=1 Tax=unclassified Sphingomonas TaxID=196159 RepID=UPI0006FFC908|nr:MULTISPECIES: amidohydrolase [unclassified Sphingomonas]KQX20838.1 metal-dependent hydrolase [Sphingomonas sp. Root1294]KQY68684.1 metal-dependent hydrolase [Sphingomonas sp. Root50]KRB88089.1 metal-dependent hydrolase [Sphingomonas sp. Root720]